MVVNTMYLVVNSIPLGDQHTINTTTTASPKAGCSGEVLEGTIEFGKLIDSFISNKGFSNEDDFVRVVC